MNTDQKTAWEHWSLAVQTPSLYLETIFKFLPHALQQQQVKEWEKYAKLKEEQQMQHVTKTPKRDFWEVQ